LLKQAELVAQARIADAPEAHSEIHGFRKADRREKFAAARNAETDRCLPRRLQDAALDGEQGERSVEPAVVLRVIDVPVGIAIRPTTGNLAPPRKVGSSLVTRNALTHVSDSLQEMGGSMYKEAKGCFKIETSERFRRDRRWGGCGRAGRGAGIVER